MSTDNIQKVVTFYCQNTIHVYMKDSSVLPMSPYKIHGSIEEAKIYIQKQRLIANPKIIKYDSVNEKAHS